eukprot:2868801-Prymnesium_polylepis.1
MSGRRGPPTRTRAAAFLFCILTDVGIASEMDHAGPLPTGPPPALANRSTFSYTPPSPAESPPGLSVVQ